MKRIIAYFETHGVTNETLLSKGITMLYRGVESKIGVQKHYVERGFMSTSWKKHIAKRFAFRNDKNGLILCLATNLLPSSVKYVIIDTTIAPYLNESELLFMPGFIEQTPSSVSKDACIRCKYTPAIDVINRLKNAPMPKQKTLRGGASSFNMMEEIQRSLGKVLVYYRVRYQQPVEIFERLDIPSDFKKAVDMIRFNKVMLEQRFEEAMDMIPEYVTLRNKMADVTTVTDDDMNHIKGFEVFPALYDPKTNEVLTIHCMLPADFFYEFFDEKRTKDVIAYIKRWATSQIWFDL